MPPKKKLSKKEKARLEAEQAELLRIEMEKEKLKKLEEERQRKQVELEQAKRRQQQEIQENKERRKQLKDSMNFFNAVQQTINGIKTEANAQSDWEKYMRCNGLPNANSPSDLRKYIHQWRADIAERNQRSRNWLLRTDERTLLTQDANVPDLTRATLRRKQINLGDVYAKRVREVLGILEEIDEALLDKSKPSHILADLLQLKTETRAFVKDHLDEFTYKIMSHIERDMEIDRPGVSKHDYTSDVFKCFFWTFSKDAQISLNPKPRVGEQPQHIEINFPMIEMEITLPPVVQLQLSALRGIWLNFDHLSDYCSSFNLKKRRPETFNILLQTKREWHKRKEILQDMLDECTKETTLTLDAMEGIDSKSSPRKQRSFDIDKLYAEYEDNLNKCRKQSIGPAAYNLLETDVNLRKYRIIGGVYCIDYLDIPGQDKRLNARSFIRTIVSPDTLNHKDFFQTYKPPPPVQPGVRRLPEEIEAEMRMIEAALDKLALVTLQLPDSVIWFEPPIACRWETYIDTLESDLTEGIKPPTTATPTDHATPMSTFTNPSPIKCSPRFPSKQRKRSTQKSPTRATVHEVTDFDMLNIPSDIDIYSLFKDFVVPRLPYGFNVHLNTGIDCVTLQKDNNRQPKVLFFARHHSVASCGKDIIKSAEHKSAYESIHGIRINEEFLDLNEPRELFPRFEFDKILKFKDLPINQKDILSLERQMSEEQKIQETVVAVNGNGHIKVTKTNGHQDGRVNGNGNGSNQKNGNGNGRCVENGKKTESVASSYSKSTSKASSESEYRRSSKGSDSEKKDSSKEIRKAYMFSELIEDLERLCELQKPKQEEVLNQISEKLTPTTSTEGSQKEGATAVAPAATEEEELAKSFEANLMQPAFSYFTGISFIRDMLAKNGSESKETTKEAEDDESSEYDDEDDYDEYDENPNENGKIVDNLNALGGDSGRGGGVAENGGSAGDVHGLFSHHSQSESDNNDGKKSKISNIIALTKGKWSTRDVHDTKFNEDKLSIQFRTGRLGIFGFALNRYSNMPYQAWEIKPDFKNPGSVLFSFTASIVSLDMSITSAGYCMNNFQGGTTDAINDMIGKTLSLADLKATLISSAVDIFPDEDAFCYTEGSCEKNYVMEMHLYVCMSTLALSHNFSWSRWNLLAGSRTAVLLLRELIENRKVPNHSTLLVTPLKTAIIDCTEVSASFNATGIPGMEYYADLYQLSQVHALPSSLEKQRTMDPVLRDNVARILMAIRPLSFC